VRSIEKGLAIHPKKLAAANFHNSTTDVQLYKSVAREKGIFLETALVRFYYPTKIGVCGYDFG
jgi:hypothetical protein